MNFSKQPFSSFGVDFVILFFKCCIAGMPLDRGLELRISVDCGLLWSVWAFVLQLLLGSLSMLKDFPGYCNECLLMYMFLICCRCLLLYNILVILVFFSLNLSSFFQFGCI